mgnify:CR=1 FL=1
MKLDSAIFYSNNLAVTLPFYRDVLGFAVDYVQEGRFVSLKLDGGKLGIKQRKEAREIPGHQTVFIEVDNIESVYKGFQEKNITFLKELTKEDWATNFSLLDPDGNKVQFLSKN